MEIKNYYILIPVNDVNILMLKEAFSEIYESKNYTCGKFEYYMDHLRIVTDISVTPNVDYFVIKTVNKFPVTLVGFKKHTLNEIKIELSQNYWKHNQE